MLSFLPGQYVDTRLGELTAAAGPTSLPEGALSVELRGLDYASVARVMFRGASGTELFVSNHQRIAPGSPLTLGGEVLLSQSRLWGIPAAAAKAVSQVAGAKGAAAFASPVEWAVGGTYTTDKSKVGRGWAASVVCNAVVDAACVPGAPACRLASTWT